MATSSTAPEFNSRLTWNIMFFQIDCHTVIIEMDDVAEGLNQLIALHGITRLVMGAAADQHYSKYRSHLPNPVFSSFTQKG